MYIKLKLEDTEFIKEAENLEECFTAESDPRPHGLFDSIQFITLFPWP